MANLVMTPQEMYNGYYAIHKTLIDNNSINFGSVSAVKDLSEQSNEISSKFADYLLSLSDWESSKEIEYLLQWENKIATVYPNSQIVNDLNKFITSTPPNVSAAIQLVEMYSARLEDRIFDEQKNFNENLQNWDQLTAAYNNAFFKKTANEALDMILDNILNMSVIDVMDYIENYTKEKWIEKFGATQSIKNFDKFMSIYAPSLKSLVYEANVFKGQIKEPLGELKAYKGKGNKEVMLSFASSIVEGLINGLSQEEFQVTFGGMGGFSTARHTSKLKYFSGKTQYVPTETDIYGAMTFDIEPNQDILNRIASVNTHEMINEKLQEISAENNFIIHYSSKDLSIAASTSSSWTAKIKGKGSFDSKIPALEELGRGLHEEEAVHNLIFQAINTGVGLMYEKKGINEVSKAITALAIQFMFEDLGIEIDSMINQQKTTNRHIHLYFINGRYYTLSEILILLNKQIKDFVSKNTIVNVGFTPASIDYYTKEVKDSNLQGIDRWNYVRNKTISNTQMQVILSASKLQKLINMSSL